MVKVSVIVPVYNGEKYVKECIESLLNQSLSEFQLIIVNDGSDDRTINICNKYCDIDKRVILINQHNQGVSAARNKGIENSIGEYICFMDCDDKVESSYLQDLYDTCEKNNVKISVCGVESIDNKEKFISNKSMDGGYYNKLEALEELFKFRNLNWGPCGKLFHKSVVKEKLTFPNLKIYEDLIFVFKAINLSEGIYFTNTCKYYYIHRNNNSAMDNFIKCPTTDVIIMANNVLSFIKEESLPIFDTSFYGLISQVIMYINNINEVDPKWQKESSKIYISETRKLLAKYRMELLINKSIFYKEKLLFLILSFCTRLYKIIV